MNESFINQFYIVSYECRKCGEDILYHRLYYHVQECSNVIPDFRGCEDIELLLGKRE